MKFREEEESWLTSNEGFLLLDCGDAGNLTGAAAATVHGSEVVIYQSLRTYGTGVKSGHVSKLVGNINFG